MEGIGMTQPPATRLSLLLRLRQVTDTEAWEEFVQLYGPLLHAYGRRHGLQDADAADLAQEVFRAISHGVARGAYDPQLGNFRSWLLTVAHHKLHDMQARQRRQCQGSGDSGILHLLEEQPTREEEDHWNRNYQWRVFVCAAARVRTYLTPATWQAFWLTAVKGKSGKEVARELGMSVAAVYLAKSRVLARLKAQIQEWDEGEPNIPLPCPEIADDGAVLLPSASTLEAPSG
jgi:RNA polymerase sigma-70 factor (ECF subfamily)